jgi:hypothetical protein
MRTLTIQAASALAAVILLPSVASADRVCRQECVANVCQEKCVETPSTQGRGDRIDRRGTIIEERREERRPAPGLELRVPLPVPNIEVR